jgi:hypothetical protein
MQFCLTSGELPTVAYLACFEDPDNIDDQVVC